MATPDRPSRPPIRSLASLQQRFQSNFKAQHAAEYARIEAKQKAAKDAPSAQPSRPAYIPQPPSKPRAKARQKPPESDRILLQEGRVPNPTLPGLSASARKRTNPNLRYKVHQVPTITANERRSAPPHRKPPSEVVRSMSARKLATVAPIATQKQPEPLQRISPLAKDKPSLPAIGAASNTDQAKPKTMSPRKGDKDNSTAKGRQAQKAKAWTDAFTDNGTGRNEAKAVNSAAPTTDDTIEPADASAALDEFESGLKAQRAAEAADQAEKLAVAKRKQNEKARKRKEEAAERERRAQERRERMKEREREREAERQAKAAQQQQRTAAAAEAEEEIQSVTPAEVRGEISDARHEASSVPEQPKPSYPKASQEADLAPDSPVQTRTPAMQPMSEPIDDMPIGTTTSSAPQVIEADDGTTVVLVPCNSCGRKFNEARIDKHRAVCAKQQQTKRKAFNVKQQRLQAMGSEAVAFAKTANKTEKRYAKKVEARKGNWRKQHENFVASIRAAKGDGPPAPALEDPSLVKCDFCGRTFHEEAANRHIPICKRKAQEQKMKSKAKRK
eukprot:m.76396 g.76396  ORF g.76396 m.76396 type:complete len:559 (-) comp14428_c0_seq1:1383-3059(-)